MLTNRGWADGREGAGKWRRKRRRPGFPPSSTLVAQRRVQALGLMAARGEQVAAAAAFSVTVHLIAPTPAGAAAGGEAAVVGVPGMGGGAAGPGVVPGRRSLVGRCRRQAEEVWELQVVFVQQASLVVGSVALSFGYEVEEL